MSTKPTATPPEGPTGEFQEDIKVNDTPPSKSMLEKSGKLTVLDAKKQSYTFKSLYERSRKGGAQRVLMVFIRHFFCGNCQEYIRTLSQVLPPSTLSSLSVPTELIVIGCGTPDLIPMYVKETSCPYPIYAEQTTKLYAAMGMTRTLSLGNKTPQYMQQPLRRVVIQSIFQEFRSGRKMLSGGDFWQVGGEFVFETDGRVSWCHRMKNTRDHAEMSELKRHLGMTTAAAVSAGSSKTETASHDSASLGKTVGSRRNPSTTGSGLARRLSERRKSWRSSMSHSRSGANGDADDSASISTMERLKEEGPEDTPTTTIPIRSVGATKSKLSKSPKVVNGSGKGKRDSVKS